MSGFAWADVLALLTSIGFGVVSAVVPIANAEAYVIASQVSAVAGSVPIAIGVGIGQAVGKLLLFLGVRRGKDFAIFRRRREQRQREPKPTGPARAKLRTIGTKLLDLVGQKRWGLPIVGIAAIIGIPPLYAVALLAGATTMRAILFALVVMMGRITRFVLVALGISGMHDWFF